LYKLTEGGRTTLAKLDRFVAVAAAVCLCAAIVPPAVAWHPEDDAAWWRLFEEEPPDNETCDENNKWDGNAGSYMSHDFEYWRCMDEPSPPAGIEPFTYWEPILPAGPAQSPEDDGDVKHFTEWKPVPGTNLYQLTTSRAEWIDVEQAGDCTQTACKFKGGADIILRGPGSTAPVTTPANTLKNAVQLYVWNGTAWEFKSGTAWRSEPQTDGTVTTTWNWGTAPFGAAYYNVVGHFAQMVGGTQVTVGNSQTGPVWDPPPNYRGTKPPKPDKKLKPGKVKKVQKFGPQPTLDVF
jgi:hypothetical protein